MVVRGACTGQWARDCPGARGKGAGPWVQVRWRVHGGGGGGGPAAAAVAVLAGGGGQQ